MRLIKTDGLSLPFNWTNLMTWWSQAGKVTIATTNTRPCHLVSIPSTALSLATASVSHGSPPDHQLQGNFERSERCTFVTTLGKVARNSHSPWFRDRAHPTLSLRKTPQVKPLTTSLCRRGALAHVRHQGATTTIGMLAAAQVATLLRRQRKLTITQSSRAQQLVLKGRRRRSLARNSTSISSLAAMA